jgi:hypothetical protein
MKQTRKTLLNEYFLIIDTGTIAECERFLSNRKLLIEKMGRVLYRELILNYRAKRTPEYKNKILNQFEILILNKRQRHTSDIAIAHNIISNVKLTREEETLVLDFLWFRTESYFSKQMILAIPKATYSIRKSLIIDKSNIIFKQLNPRDSSTNFLSLKNLLSLLKKMSPKKSYREARRST